jgi:hypothetical protein
MDSRDARLGLIGALAQKEGQEKSKAPTSPRTASL